MQYYNSCASPKRKPHRQEAEGAERLPPLLAETGGCLGWGFAARTKGLGWLGSLTEAGGERAQRLAEGARTEGLRTERGQRRQLANARSPCPRQRGQWRGRSQMATADRTSASRPERPQPPKPASSTEPPAKEGAPARPDTNARNSQPPAQASTPPAGLKAAALERLKRRAVGLKRRAGATGIFNLIPV